MTRRFIAIVAVLLVVASCARSGQETETKTSGKYGSGVDVKGLDDAKKKKDVTKPAATARSGSGAAGAAAEVPRGAQVGQAPPLTQNTFAADKGGTGRNSAHYLRGTHYKKLVIEISVAEGAARPEPAALEHLRARLAEVVDKPGGIEILPPKTIPSTKGEYTRDDFATFEDRFRKRYSGAKGGDIVLHYLFLNGKEADASPAPLGIAWRASSIVIFSDQIERISDQLTFTPAELQKSVLLHEAGHNLALLNFGHQTPRPHWDEKNRTHSKSKGSVMFWALEHGENLVENFLTGKPAQVFDADDKADLADIRSGKLKPYGI